MKILLIVLSIIGLLKLVSLFIILIIHIVFAIRKERIDGINRTSCLAKINECYIIPTIDISFSGEYKEIMFYWLCFEYYCSYTIDKGK